MDNVYYKGELIPAKDWDYETSKPKQVSAKKEAAKSVVTGVPTEEE
ncbi:hypothetical protein UFOVP660_17 [uncultured Caudovirales phage]|uniref:Uncharacterized protein n=1 Tax=uncultured Caudovirales phage TaxID=2100421 RepID=A0A6J5NA97_9CAUD|nr:hypothetical protein UFOVP660_17 [uncultured Caudovirales phage]